MDRSMGFDWAEADKTIKVIEFLLKDYEGEAREQLLKRANYFQIKNTRAQYAEHNPSETKGKSQE